MTAAENTKKQSDAKIGERQIQLNQVELLTKIGKEVSGNADRKLLVLEMVKALYAAFGREPGSGPEPSPLELPYNKRTDLHITKIDSMYQESMQTYLTETIKSLYDETSVLVRSTWSERARPMRQRKARERRRTRLLRTEDRGCNDNNGRWWRRRWWRCRRSFKLTDITTTTAKNMRVRVTNRKISY